MNTTTTSTSGLPGRDTVGVTAHTVASLTELLGMCEEFLRTASPLVHAELRAYLAHQAPPADPSWFLDMLGFSSVHLGHLLPASTVPPSEAWRHERHDQPEHRGDDEQVWA